jgi:uncharacterized 2Fe-2S/4Fe-4S cluster protein (DUF4445 family)
MAPQDSMEKPAGGNTIRIQTDQGPIAAEKETSLLEAMVASGLLLRSDCGGRGRCGKCTVRVSAPGALSEPDPEEVLSLGEDRIGAGERLACRARVLADLRLEIPEGSLLVPEVVQKGSPVLLSRLEAAEVRRGPSALSHGVAVDIGTTTIAVYLCDPATRTLKGSTSVRNPQAIFGDDVISRIGAVRTCSDGLKRLQKMVVSAIDWAITALCRRDGVDPRGIESMVAVGNSTMLHLLLGEDPTSIGTHPFAPRFVEARSLPAEAVGLGFNPRASLRTLPLISGYLGADIVSAAIATELSKAPIGTMLIDIGTNGEVMLSTPEGLAATSCATGPAFEGATLRHGMQATSGAIEAVRYKSQGGYLDYTLVQRDPTHPKKASGICGSGVVSAVSELLRARVIQKGGGFDPLCGSPCLREGENGILEFEIVPGKASRNGRAITLTQSDVRAVQLAKGALRTGMDLLCRESGMERPRKLLLAGAFGSFIPVPDAIRIGMFPELEPGQIEVVGNAAGAGAILALYQEETFEESKRIAEKTRVFNLAAHPDFQRTFIHSLSF